MGVHNKERRQDKAKDRQRRARARAGAGHQRLGHHNRCSECERMSHGDAVALLVLSASMTFRHGVPAAANPNVRRLAELYDSDDERAGHVDAALVALVNEQIDGVWQEGWQPADVARVLRRNGTELAAAMAADCMAAHLDAFAPTMVDERFRAQLAALRADPEGGKVAGFLRRWVQRTGADSTTVVCATIELADALGHLPELPRLVPPPGHASWAPQPRSGETVDPKLLERVRALLAKAEASEYGAEADSFTAKAQELMVRHSIDQALLAPGTGAADEPSGIRIGLDNPYEAEKAMLLDRVATANRCKAVWSRYLGFVTVLGYPADLRAVELLYTSLLVQVSGAMLREGSRRTAFGGSRTRSFRQSFLSAFATRIGERLSGVTESGIREGAAGDSRLLPVLAGRGQAVRLLTEELFPDLTHDQRGKHTYDREGWAMGTHAADLAALTAIPSITDHRTAGDPAVTHPMIQVEAVQDTLFPVPHKI